MTPLEDLRRSGLTDETIAAMKIRRIEPKELQSKGWLNVTDAYAIPYFGLNGKLLEDRHCRYRLLPGAKIGGKEVRYLQEKGSIGHAYLPPTVRSSQWLDPAIPIVITEGEKKACAGVQANLLCLGLGGVNSWRTRSFRVDPERMSQSSDNGSYTIRVTSDSEAEEIDEQIVPEMLEIPWDQREVIICFDSDCQENPNVQRAAFELSVWLAGEGASVSQALLPHKSNPGKMGLDDYLVRRRFSPEAFWELERTYAQHPRVRQWLRKNLDNPKLKRSDQVKAAMAVLNSLDAKGQRLVDPGNGSYYYLDDGANVLHSFRWESQDIRQIRLSSFGGLLQDRFGLGATDAQVVGRVADLFTSGPRIRSVVPRKVSWCRGGSREEDALYYQLSDSFVAKVTAEDIEVVNNGTDDILFLSNQVEPLRLPWELLVEEPGEPRWITTLADLNIQPMEPLSREQTLLFLAALFYLSPLLRRWRGLMLPVELMISEPNSGKTFLYNLRKAILTGRPTLSNSPNSLRDWYAQLSSSPGMWICDNLGDLQREMREGLSDELARLVTDPEPKIEMRKLYTTIETGTWPVDSSFAVTAIRNPFWKPDILQRSIIVRLKAIPAGQRDSQWYSRQLEGNGRALWVADHLHMCRRFFEEVKNGWSETYLSGHRLVHFEQALLCMGRAMGYDEEMHQVVRGLAEAVQSQIASGDPIIECLKLFVQEWEPKKGDVIKASDIINWVEMDPEDRFTHLRMMRNSVLIGKYMSSHEYDVKESAGLEPFKRHNQTLYRIIRKKGATSGETDQADSGGVEDKP